MSKIKGFTLLELIVSLAIFAFMTAFLLAKYGTFNQSVLLTDLAYDTAVSIQTAQSTALDEQGIGVVGQPNPVFNAAYGVEFTPSNAFTYFVNTNPPSPPYITLAGSHPINIYTMKAGDVISGICVGTSDSSCNTSVSTLDVAFQRPNPDAEMTATPVSGGTVIPPGFSYANITILGTDGETRHVGIWSTGQVTVTNN